MAPLSGVSTRVAPPPPRWPGGSPPGGPRRRRRGAGRWNGATPQGQSRAGSWSPSRGALSSAVITLLGGDREERSAGRSWGAILRRPAGAPGGRAGVRAGRRKEAHGLGRGAAAPASSAYMIHKIQIVGRACPPVEGGPSLPWSARAARSTNAGALPAAPGALLPIAAPTRAMPRGDAATP